jgi:DNA mismatch endonuclease (patch repair protein)
MDKLTKEQRRKNMQAVKSKDSEIEKMLRLALWSKGYKYRKNVKSVFGKPDIVFKSKHIVVFCDSEFWHGYNWKQRKKDFKSNQDFWIPKIERNIQRDKEVNEKLIQDGWKVLRFWGYEIKENLEVCVSKIENALRGGNENDKIFRHKK